jgi:hypothetical protein
LTCLSANRCESCKTLSNRNIIPYCGCLDGYYDKDGEGCVPCVAPGKVCLSLTEYRTCSDGFYWEDGENGA